MAARPRLRASPVSTTGALLPSCARRLAQELVPEIAGGFGALSHLAAIVRCAKGQTSSGIDGIPSKGIQHALRQQFFSDPTQWWDNRRIEPTPLHPDFRHKHSKDFVWLNRRHSHALADSQAAAWDAGMKRPPDEAVSTLSQEHRAIGWLGAHEGHLNVGMCRKLCESGRITDAVDALDLLVQRRCHVDIYLLYRVLKSCIANKDLVLGRRVHALTIKKGYESDAFLATHFIRMYASHGWLEEAMQVFSKVPAPDAYNWATIIFAYARHGDASQAICLYRQMRESTVRPTDHIYVAVLKAVAMTKDLFAGKEVHAHIIAGPGKPDIFVQTCLVSMYAKCGNLEDARSVFDKLPQKDVVTWTAMIAGYTQQGMGQEALTIYSSMQHEGLSPPNSVTFVCLLQACASVGAPALQQGKQLHAQTEEQGLQHDVVVGGSLVNMYAKCGSLEEARRWFDRLADRNVVTWTAMIAGYAEQGMGWEALSLYSSMEQEAVTPNAVTYISLLKACASEGAGALLQGKRFHAHIEEQGLQRDMVLGGGLVTMYAKCSSLEDARCIFHRLPNKNVITWNAMLAGYIQQDMGEEALTLYSNMLQEGITFPNSLTFVSLLQACASIGVRALLQGKQFHVQIQEQGLQDDVVLSNTLVSMYAKCGSFEEARSMFDRLAHRDVVAWNVLFAGYSQQGMCQEALGLYNSMQQEGVAAPNFVTFVCLLRACASVGVGALHQGHLLHAQIVEQGLQGDVVLGGSLVNMYVKCGSLESARSVFDTSPHRSLMTWTSMIAGYAQQGMGQEALCLYKRMQQEGLTADSVTFLCLLQACAFVAALPLGKQIHAQIVERGLQADVAVGVALVNMYAKCGSMFDSQQVFLSLPERTVEAWNALIGGYTYQGDSEVVFELVDSMILEGIPPDGMTFLSVLTVCSHVGLVDEGRKYFKCMILNHGISPTVEHYTCMMDLLGRAGHLDEALETAKTIPLPCSSTVWHSLLGSCRKWNNIEIGRQAFEFAVNVDGKDAAAHVLMSNIYANAQMWEKAKELQARRVKSGAWKEPGQSWWTDVGGVVHTFVVGEMIRPEIISVQG